MIQSTRYTAPRRLVAVAFVSLLVPSCGGGKSPASSTTVTTLPSSTAPVAADASSATCSLGKGDVNATCEASSGSARLQIYVETAIDLVVREKPELLDLTLEERPNSGTYRVKNTEAYLDALVTNIRRQGACAERDADSLNYRRILAKDSNDFSEAFELLSVKGYIQRGREALVQSCEPAAFPVDRLGDLPPAGSGCGKPYPPPIDHFAAKVHVYGPNSLTLDSTPLVGPDAAYCAAIGYTDGRLWCPVRMEQDAERVACEAWRVGKAEDTGRYGPTWTFQGQYCTGQASGCENHPDNQYGLTAWANGLYVMCDAQGACGEVTVDR